MNRFFNWLKAIFNRGMDKLEDPELMLDQAKRDMQGALIANREKAVQAITQKNRLQAMLEDTKKKSAQLESQATMALQQGKRDLALAFMREKTTNDSTLSTLQASYDQAVQTVEQVKIAVKRQDEEVRKKTAEALAMKAQWKQTQIQNSIAKALEGLTFENQFEAFGAAADKIRDAQSEAAARQEMVGTSVQGKMMEMQDSMMDSQAELDLQALESKLGMRQDAATTTATTTTQAEQQQVSVGGDTPAATSAPAAPNAAQLAEADRQLEELEQRLKGS